VHIPPLQTASADDALDTADAEGARLLARDLETADFSARGIDRAIRIGVSVTRQPGDLPYLLTALDEGPIGTLIRLFRVGIPVERAAVEAALPSAGVERLVAMRVLDVDGDAVVATVAIDRKDDLFVASDWEPADREPDRPDHVIAPLQGTNLLRMLAPRDPVRSMLDVGAGTGFMALAALREHAERATATDTSPRSLRFVRFNGMLNGLDDRLAVHEGSLFEPVGDERFDLVLCNPPYLVSPENAFVYRDGGEGICRALVEAAPRHLEEGGIFVCLASWTHAKDADWQGPLRAWTAGSGCDVLAFGLASSDPLTYAAGWGRAPGRDLVVTGPRLLRWLAWFDDHGIELVSWGAILLRRRSGGDNWFHGETPPGEANAYAGPQIRRLLAAQDLLQALGPDPEALLEVPLVLPDDHRIEQVGRFVPDGSEVESLTLRFGGGLGTRIALDLPTAQALAALDGRRTPREVLHAAAHGIGAEDPDAFARAGVAGFRRLLELGLLEPSGGR
jgi:SAM-dependent methyltransferase